jgi:hypothetical protein
MSQRRGRFLYIDTSTWPVVDHHALAAGRKKAFVARRMAIELYICELALHDIAKQTGINSRQLYWLLHRCLKQSEDR